MIAIFMDADNTLDSAVMTEPRRALEGIRVMEYTTTHYGRQNVVRERGGVQHSGWPGGAFETLDGKWIVFTAPAQHLFERLCAMIGQPELPRDPRFASAAERPKHIGVILELMRRWFA